jgi:hypothetical protein
MLLVQDGFLSGSAMQLALLEVSQRRHRALCRHQLRYRLIDSCCEPHTQIDGLYDSLDEAIGEAIAWLQNHGLDPLQSRVGVEVSTASGDWRTCRLPGPLLCPLLCTLPP